MKRAPSRLQLAALMAAAALGLHQARYLVGAGGGGHLSPGHSYFTLLIPLIGALCTLGLALFVRRVSQRTASPRRTSLLHAWWVASAGLLAIYAGQESLESLLSSWPGGIADAVLGNGGWIALPLAVLFGALVAFVLRGAQAIVSLAARRPRPLRPARNRLRPLAARRPRQAPLRHLAARGPPRLSAVR